MTSEPPFADPDTEPLRKLGSGERKRAALVLAVLAVAAIVLVGVLYAVSTSGGSGGGPTTAANPLPTGPAVKVTGVPTQATSSSRSPAKPPTAPSTTAPSSTTRTGPVSCPTSAPCALPDDIGNAIKAVNDYRAAHGQQAIAGAVTKRAKKCAVGNGDTGSCPSGYFWEPVGRSGAQVVSKIAASPKGKAFLLDKSMTAVEVGWAYIPRSHSYECVLVGPN